MPNIHVVTDSGARFSNPRLLSQYPLTILPYKLDIGGKLYREDIDITGEEAMRLIKSQNTPPKLIAPSEEEYADLYASLSRNYEGIISIHSSRELSQSWYNARNAAQRMGDACEVVAIDSRTICAGQGMLCVSRGKQPLMACPMKKQFSWCAMRLTVFIRFIMSNRWNTCTPMN